MTPNSSHAHMKCSVRTFKIDVTPPLGDYLCGGLHETSQGIETPLYLRGVVISANSTKYVLGCVDYCYLRGRSHDRYVESLAAAAGVPVNQVVLHSNHVHDAPLIDEEGHATVEQYHKDLKLHNEEYFSRVLVSSRQGIESALAEPGISITKIAFTSSPVEEFGSRRPVVDETGQCQVRWSVCQDQELRNKPEGLIDPALDQINLYGDDGQPVVSMNFYASHPQVSDGRRMVSSDVVGVALDAFEQRNPGVFTLYFTGCAGNVTAGKYTTLDREQNRIKFGNRLFDAMQRAFEKSLPGELNSMHWLDTEGSVSLSQIHGDEKHYEQIITTSTSNSERYLAALKLNRLRREVYTYPFRISRLVMNDASVLFMPTELCVEYQLYAKSICQGNLAVAAYGDCYLNYVATAPAFDEGGYEVRPQWTEVDRKAEKQIKDQVDKVLQWVPQALTETA